LKTHKYIVIEGLDKSGKTTLINTLKEEIDAEYIREPTPTFLRDFIGRIKKMDHPNEKEILMNLFAADRLLLKPIIDKAKKENRMVISDRSKFSSYAYQGRENFSYNQVVNKFMPNPDILIYLKAPIKTLKSRGFSPADKFEDPEFLKEVKEMFEAPIHLYCARNKIKFVEIDATQSPEKVLKDVKEVIEC